MSEMKSAAAQAASLMQALSHEARLMMLCMLVEGEHSVSELATVTGLRQAAVSQHLAALREQGLVTSRREGRRRLYRHCDEAAREVVLRLYELYCPQPLATGEKAGATGSILE